MYGSIVIAPKDASPSVPDEHLLVENLPKQERELTLYLPLYKHVTVRGRIALQLKLSQHHEEVVVRDESPVVNVYAAGNRDAVSVERGLVDNLSVLDQDYVRTLSRFLDPAGGTGGSPTLIVDGAEARNIGVSASTIQEIRIHQNPDTAEYPRWSRRRIEVITKTAADKYHGNRATIACSHRQTRQDFSTPKNRGRIVSEFAIR